MQPTSPIDAELVRRLLAQREGTHLDFKGVGYDFSHKRKGNAEFAKDIMAMANALGVGAERAYILIGVVENPDRTGRVVGVPAESHPDDAVVQQKAGSVLNKVPGFTYVPVDVDGVSVGVVEIRAGGRPYYPTTDAPPLRRNVAYVRVGTSTDEASPAAVYSWAEEDDSIGREARRLQAVEARANLLGILDLRPAGGGGDGATYCVSVTNVGGRALTLLDAYVLWESPGATPEEAVRVVKRQRILPGDLTVLEPNVPWFPQARLGHDEAKALGSGSSGASAFQARFVVECRNEATGEAVRGEVLRRPGDKSR